MIPWERIGRALVLGFAVGLGCLALGMLLGSLNVPPADAVAGFLTTFAWAIGILAGCWYFLRGSILR